MSFFSHHSSCATLLMLLHLLLLSCWTLHYFSYVIVFLHCHSSYTTTFLVLLFSPCHSSHTTIPSYCSSHIVVHFRYLLTHPLLFFLCFHYYFSCTAAIFCLFNMVLPLPLPCVSWSSELRHQLSTRGKFLCIFFIFWFKIYILVVASFYVVFFF
jgi:hypothetical protein